MIANLKPYPVMKDSGVEWLGDVPEHWDVPRLKDVGYLKSGAGFPYSYQGNLSAEFPFFKVGDMAVAGNERLMQVWKHTVSADTGNILGAHVFLPNTIVFAKVGAALLLNRRRVLTRPSCIDNNMMGFLPRGHSTEWMCHWLSTVDFRMMVNPGAVPSVNEGQLEVLPVLVPPLPEQAAIVCFLDHADRRIRRYIRAKQKLIGLLEEQKQAIINQAVTGQVDVRTGRPYRAYKDSGVEWLGDVPAHWEVIRNGQLFVQRNETGFPELPILEVSLKTGVSIRDLDDSNRKQMMSVRSEYKRAVKGDIAYNMMRMWQGAVGVAPVDGLVSPAYVVAKPLRGTEPRYFNALFRTSAYMVEVDKYSHGIVKDRNRLYWEEFKQIPITGPPPDEQVLIADAIDQSTATMNDGLSRIRRQIELIQEYRTRLIADVVTGKLDVREVAAGLPDEIEEPEPFDETSALIDGEEEPSDNLETVPKEAEV